MDLRVPSSILSVFLRNLKHQHHFYQLLSHAITTGLFTDPFLSSKLLLFSVSQFLHDLSFSRSLFAQIQSPNIFAYNFMFKAHSYSSTPVQSITLYNQMLRSDVWPDNYTFPFIFKACGRLSLLDKGQEVHSLSLKLGLEHDVFVQNALISMYSSCGNVEMARSVFYMIPARVRDVVSWNSMISGFLHSELNVPALELFLEMLGDGCVTVDEVTLVTSLTACGRLGFLDLGREIHGFVMRNWTVLDVFLGSSLIDMYAKCAKMEVARKVFDKIPDRNLVCWTSMIVGFAQLDMFKEAIELYREMQQCGVMADAPLVACVISACGHTGALEQGKWVHNYCERNGIDINLSVSNALIDMYSKCGDVEKALQIFNELTERDVFSWTAMISGLAMDGETDKALDLFSQMEMSIDIMPNEVTFLGVLSACSHSGYVDKGFYYFKAMTQIYGLTPHIEHYGCMVDLLGRANLLIETKNFIQTMPIRPDVVIWRSLLFACRSHGNIELAELATNKIEELEPRRCGAPVLLSSVYASASRWDDANRVRKRIRKKPGCSFIEINGLVREFFVEDSSHGKMDATYGTIMGIHKLIRFEGFDLGVTDHQ